MTNEELCISYQNGNQGAVFQLWEQNQRLILQKSFALYIRHKDRVNALGHEYRDIAQNSYFSVEAAAKGFDPEAGTKFITYLDYHIKNAFFSLIGMKTRSGINDPFINARRLEEEIPGDTEDICLSDTIPDQRAAAAFESIIDSVFFSSLREELENALHSLPDPTDAELLRLRYFSMKKPKEIAEILGLEVQCVRHREANALHYLKKRAWRVKKMAAEVIEIRAYSNSGFNAWKYSGSVQERAVEALSFFLKKQAI